VSPRSSGPRPKKPGRANLARRPLQRRAELAVAGAARPGWGRGHDAACHPPPTRAPRESSDVRPLLRTSTWVGLLNPLLSGSQHSAGRRRDKPPAAAGLDDVAVVVVCINSAERRRRAQHSVSRRPSIRPKAFEPNRMMSDVLRIVERSPAGVNQGTMGASANPGPARIKHCNAAPGFACAQPAATLNDCRFQPLQKVSDFALGSCYL